MARDYAQNDLVVARKARMLTARMLEINCFPISFVSLGLHDVAALLGRIPSRPIQ